jgi:hypothetical protein
LRRPAHWSGPRWATGERRTPDNHGHWRSTVASVGRSLGLSTEARGWPTPIHTAEASTSLAAGLTIVGRAAARQHFKPHEARRDTRRRSNGFSVMPCDAWLRAGRPAGVPRWHARAQAARPYLRYCQKFARNRATHDRTTPYPPPSTARAHLCDCAGHEVPQGAVNQPSIDGMQGVRGSNPLSSTTKLQVRQYGGSSRTLRVVACCQQGTPWQHATQPYDCARRGRGPELSPRRPRFGSSARCAGWRPPTARCVR